VVMEVGRRGPGSLLDCAYNVMHILFDTPVRFKGNFKISVEIISESRPVYCFCAEGGWAGLGDRFRMQGSNSG
jgi:hypothetical protein